MFTPPPNVVVLKKYDLIYNLNSWAAFSGMQSVVCTPMTVYDRRSLYCKKMHLDGKVDCTCE